MSNKYIFDICWTLYKVNTTFDFIYFFHKKNRKIHYLDFLGYKFVRSTLILIGKVLGIDIYRALYIFSLKGYSKVYLEDMARKYVENILIDKKILFSHQLLEKSVNNKDNEIFLCSASLDCIVQAVSVDLGVSNFYSSELEYVDGVCSGKLKKDLLYTKADLFKNGNRPFWVVTDNKTDLDLIRQSENYTILSNKKNMKFWKKYGLSVGFILED